MAQYRKKPVVIEAVQLTIENVKNDNITNFLSDKFTGYINENKNLEEVVTYIDTLEDRMKVSTNDYIIKGVQGEFYPCKPDIFELTYEIVKDNG
jgi:uncharacterized protein YeeX (DUF496 family)